MENKNRKFTYWKVIQQHYGGCYGWEDVSHYEANSNGSTKDYALLKHDAKEYRTMGFPTRIIFRREAVKLETI
jgi:hypothetical protein